MDKIIVGIRINEVLKEKGMSRAELARRMGRTSQTVVNWCTGVSNPNVATLAEIAEKLGVSIDYLIYGKKRRPTTDDKLVSVEEVLETIRDIARYPEAELRADYLIDRLEWRLMRR